MTTICVATRNPGKLREYAELLDDLQVSWVMLSDLGIVHDVAETGSTLAENARLKAVAYGEASGLLTLADDSGLMVDALDGAPGVYSARFGGPGLDDEGRWRLLLDTLADVPDPARTARFRCVVALRTPAGEVFTADGACEGRIIHAPRGSNGFGYDPVFLVDGRNQTMAELPPALKNRISHRANALAAIRPVLLDLLKG